MHGLKPIHIWVFLGPSLDLRAAMSLLSANFRPPAKAGDLLRAASSGAQWIGLIDGEFDQSLAVGPREVSTVMRQGVRVYGGGSMGALRAAELFKDGMTGVGQIFEWYRDGFIEAEDEVALAFDGATFRPLSTPLVCIRDVVSQATQEGIITPKMASHVIAAARRQFYARRSLEGAIKGAGLYDVLESLLALDSAIEHDLKARDAQRLLLRMESDLREVCENLCNGALDG